MPYSAYCTWLNMIVSMFEGMVQAARLNFVEFFSKFYRGSGVKYKPFSCKEDALIGVPDPGKGNKS